MDTLAIKDETTIIMSVFLENSNEFALLPSGVTAYALTINSCVAYWLKLESRKLLLLYDLRSRFPVTDAALLIWPYALICLRNVLR